MVLMITLLYVDTSYFMNYFLSFEQSMKKIIMVKGKKILLKCIKMQDLHAFFFNSSIVLMILVIFIDLKNKIRIKLKSFHLDIKYEKILLINVGFWKSFCCISI